MAHNFNLKNIRAFLTDGFSDEELRHLCYDNPDFRPVYEQLAQEMGKGKVIQKLIEYSERKGLIETLLVVGKELNPAKYAEHRPYHTATPIPDTPMSTATVTSTPTPAPQPASRSTPDALPSGSTVNTDDGWALRVVDVKYSDRLEQGDFVYIAEGRYVHLVLEVTNNKRRTETFGESGSLEMVIGSGLSYQPNPYASIINNDVYGIGIHNRPIKLKPGDKGFTVVSFDIPIDSSGPYMLKGGILHDLDAKVIIDVE